MITRVVVPIITALVLLGIGAFWMFTVLIGANGFNSSQGEVILGGNLVMVIITVVISSVVSGWLAHVLQKRSGMSPWLAAPLSVVAVTVVAVIALFLVGLIIFMAVDSTRTRPPHQQQPPSVNRRGGGR